MSGKNDTGLWIIALSALLTLSGVSLLFCPTAHAGSPAPTLPKAAPHLQTTASKTALTLQPDDDGDELLEHWSDPKYVREERLQTLGIAGALAGAGVFSICRRRSARRASRHG